MYIIYNVVCVCVCKGKLMNIIYKDNDDDVIYRIFYKNF